MGKMRSRKLWVLIIQVIVTIGLPLVYRSLDVEGDITLFVLIAINGAAAIYTGSNILSKKYHVDLPQRSGSKSSNSTYEDTMRAKYGG